MARVAKKSSIRAKRDDPNGPVLVIPHCVLNSPAYLTLSGNAVRLLYDLAMQFNGRNNGMLLASFKYLSEKRGWTSADQLNKSKKELLAHMLICQTVQGQRPNKASWYGITWQALDDIDGLEIPAQAWPRGAYRHWTPPDQIPKRHPPKKNA
ncbi:hypothetical protein EVC37_25700 [Methylocaldum sp. BRCS4]|nr:hypothetical protein [Methylocaldum sp. BRCS4]